MLREVSEQRGYNVAMAWLEAQLHDLNNQLGTKWKMDVKQLNDCASLILERHNTLKITELMFFFRGCKCGDFGEFYGTVDIASIMKGLKKFYDVRNGELARLHKEQSDAEKERKRKEADAELRKISGDSAEVYKQFLYECCEVGGAQRVYEYLRSHGVKVDIGTKDEHYVKPEECDPMRLIRLAEERERMMMSEGLNGLAKRFMKKT